MTASAASVPSTEEASLLHRRLLQGDLPATEELCFLFGDWLLQRLRNRFPSKDEHLLRDAVHQTLFDFCKKPVGYDPAKAELGTFLFVSAFRDVLNLLRREQSEKSLRIPWNLVEDGAAGGQCSQERDNPLTILLREEKERYLADWIGRVSADWTEAEKDVLELMLQGERQTGPFAAAMGLSDQSFEEQEHDVKKAKDRIKVRLQREGLPLE